MHFRRVKCIFWRRIAEGKLAGKETCCSKLLGSLCSSFSGSLWESGPCPQVRASVTCRLSKLERQEISMDAGVAVEETLGSNFWPVLQPSLAVKPSLFLQEEPKRGILLPRCTLHALQRTPATHCDSWQRLPLGALPTPMGGNS